jgi:hypothetical protein
MKLADKKHVLLVHQLLRFIIGLSVKSVGRKLIKMVSTMLLALGFYLQELFYNAGKNYLLRMCNGRYIFSVLALNLFIVFVIL